MFADGNELPVEEIKVPEEITPVNISINVNTSASLGQSPTAAIEEKKDLANVLTP